MELPDNDVRSTDGAPWLSHDESVGDVDDGGAVLRAWRVDARRWLNQHRCELERLAVRLYPAEHRLPGTTLIARPEWLVAEPVELGSLTLQLDEGPQTVGVDGSEPESELLRPLRTAGARFERYTSAMKHLSPPALFESRSSPLAVGHPPRESRSPKRRCAGCWRLNRRPPRARPVSRWPGSTATPSAFRGTA